MFERFFNRAKKLKNDVFKVDYVETPQEERFFGEIEGYSDLKKLLSKMVVSKESMHVVLVGQQKMKDCFFVDATNASGAGTVDKLFAYPRTRILLIDEIEKMDGKSQNMLLNLLETGVLTVTKVRKTQEMNFPGIKLFATSNNIDLLTEPLRSRLMELHLPEYTFDDFEKIVIKLASTRYKLVDAVGRKIADTVWNKMGTKDVRDALQLAKLVTSVEEVEETAKTIMKYGAKRDD
jgi:MoxR-like ATPase